MSASTAWHKKTRAARRSSAEANADNAYRRDLLSRAKAGDRKAFETYQRLNEGLLEKIVGDYARWVPDVDDLRQEAYLGLIKGIEEFNPVKCKEGKPEGYVFSWVRAYVSKWAKDHGPANAVRTQTTLYLDSEEEMDILESIPDERSLQDEVYRDQQFNEWIQLVTRALLPKEREVMRRRLMSENPETLAEIGDDVGLSRERIRQIELEVRKKLHKRYARDMQDAA